MSSGNANLYFVSSKKPKEIGPPSWRSLPERADFTRIYGLRLGILPSPFRPYRTLTPSGSRAFFCGSFCQESLSFAIEGKYRIQISILRVLRFHFHSRLNSLRSFPSSLPFFEVDRFGSSALRWAASQGHLEVTRESHGYPTLFLRPKNGRRQGKTPNFIFFFTSRCVTHKPEKARAFLCCVPCSFAFRKKKNVVWKRPQKMAYPG